jgi:UrcA family protein
MTPNKTFTFRRGLAALGAGAVGLALIAGPALAQTSYSDGYDPDGAYTTEGLTVYAPSRHERSATTGATIETVRASREVYYRDLDLSTRWGARELKERIKSAARSACDQLDEDYPEGLNYVPADDDSVSCYTRAVHNGMIDASYVAGYDLAAR